MDDEIDPDSEKEKVERTPLSDRASDAVRERRLLHFFAVSRFNTLDMTRDLGVGPAAVVGDQPSVAVWLLLLLLLLLSPTAVGSIDGLSMVVLVVLGMMLDY